MEPFRCCGRSTGRWPVRCSSCPAPFRRSREWRMPPWHLRQWEFKLGSTSRSNIGTTAGSVPAEVTGRRMLANRNGSVRRMGGIPRAGYLLNPARILGRQHHGLAAKSRVQLRKTAARSRVLRIMTPAPPSQRVGCPRSARRGRPGVPTWCEARRKRWSPRPWPSGQVYPWHPCAD